MTTKWRISGSALLTIAVAFWAVAAIVAATEPQAGGPATPGQAASAAQAPPAAPDQSGPFAGDDTCLACHEGQEKTIQASLHGKTQNVRTPAARPNQSCESCHGPGKEHAETGDKTKIRVFQAMAPREAADACTTCHNRSTHALWKGSAHDSRNLTCVTCHSVHSPKSQAAQLKTVTATETCNGCHKTQVAKLQRFGHMPVREGKMECSSCHNPHGSTNVRLLKIGNWVNETCVSCHTEKRGPYIWDHAPAREACSTCHDPHGSNQERMLVAKQPMLCQRCHIGTKHPSSIYDGADLNSRSNRLIGRSCVNCHSQIHGSNSPAGHAFLR
jgi:DmsE family decaheme c-type cytochrome